MKAMVDPDLCIGCQLCPQVCPEIFQMEGDKAVACRNPVPPEFMAACNQAAEQCPVAAIKLEA